MRTLVRRGDVLDHVLRHTGPLAVDQDLVVIVDGARLGRHAVREIAAARPRVLAHELRIELLVPPFVADAVPALEALRGLAIMAGVLVLREAARRRHGDEQQYAERYESHATDRHVPQRGHALPPL